MPATSRCFAHLTAILPALLPVTLVVPVLLLTTVACGAEYTEFLTANCVGCHGPDVQEQGLRLDQLEGKLADPNTFAALVRAFDRVQCAEMPPADAAQPTAAEREAFLLALGRELIVAEQTQPIPTVRRLNRVEYEHTLRDLLGLPMLQVKGMLPEDGRQQGYDKVAGALEISHIQLAKYLEAADFALRQAIVHQDRPPAQKVWRESAAMQGSAQGAVGQKSALPLVGGQPAPGFVLQIAGDPSKDFNNSYRAASFTGDADSLAVLTSVFGAHQPEGLQIDRFQPTVGGLYKVRFSVWGLRWERTKAGPAKRGMVRTFVTHGPPYAKDNKGRWQATPLPPEAAADKKNIREYRENIEFFGEGEATHVVRASLHGNPLGYFDAPSLQPTTHEFTVWLNPGDKISFHALSLPISGPSSSPHALGPLDYEGPGVAYDWFEVEGPLAKEWPPQSHARLFGEIPASVTGKPVKKGAPTPDFAGLLQAFAQRAFRRPVTAAETAPYAAIVSERLQQGDTVEEAMLAGYKGLLCSPDFLFLGLEPDEYRLASRLSYFLWDSPPDEPLLALAAHGSLSRPEVLQAQTERLLNDPHIKRFIDHFLDDWLELSKIDFTQPDKDLYPEFDPWLHDSILAETRAYFRKLIRENLEIGHLVDGEFLLLNQRMAEHYGIKGVQGAKWWDVPVPAGSKRGGLLTHASVLKVTADGTRTSPVLRGVWINERLLGIPRLPPPPNIPAVEPDSTGGVTIRQWIEKHRADPACASCHSRMDPPGLALEAFDAIGGLRERYRVAGAPQKRKVGKEMVEDPVAEVVVLGGGQGNRRRLRLGMEVDASGTLQSGDAFNDIDDLRRLLIADRDQLARNMFRQFLIYATGRNLRFSDRAEIESLVQANREQGYGMRSLLQGAISSRMFTGAPQATAAESSSAQLQGK